MFNLYSYYVIISCPTLPDLVSSHQGITNRFICTKSVTMKNSSLQFNHLCHFSFNLQSPLLASIINRIQAYSIWENHKLKSGTSLVIPRRNKATEYKWLAVSATSPKGCNIEMIVALNCSINDPKDISLQLH